MARLLRERREKFREKLLVYDRETGIEPLFTRLSRAFKLWKTQVIGIENGAYKVRAVLEPRDGTRYIRSPVVDVIVLLKVEGNDFEIVGHGDPSAPTQSGEEAVVPAIGEPSLDAVARLLRERRQEFREKLRVYNNETGIEPIPYELPSAFKLWETQVLGIENGAYRVRAVFHPDGRKGTFFWTSAVAVIVLLKIEGNDFEIVGHEDPSG